MSKKLDKNWMEKEGLLKILEGGIYAKQGFLNIDIEKEGDDYVIKVSSNNGFGTEDKISNIIERLELGFMGSFKDLEVTSQEREVRVKNCDEDIAQILDEAMKNNKNGKSSLGR